jgi:hypothetical protein
MIKLHISYRHSMSTWVCCLAQFSKCYWTQHRLRSYSNSSTCAVFYGRQGGGPFEREGAGYQVYIKCEMSPPLLLTSHSAWQPLVDTVFDQPLAICDGSTIKQMDLVAADHITVDHHIINSFGLYSTSYKWWYLHKQRRNEVILFKNFDSDENVQARCRWQ